MPLQPVYAVPGSQDFAPVAHVVAVSSSMPTFQPPTPQNPETMKCGRGTNADWDTLSARHMHDGDWDRYTVWPVHAWLSPCITRDRGDLVGCFSYSQNRYINLNGLGRRQGFTTQDVFAVMSSGVHESSLGQRLSMQRARWP